jgi:hypothetical protein
MEFVVQEAANKVLNEQIQKARALRHKQVLKACERNLSWCIIIIIVSKITGTQTINGMDFREKKEV